MTSRTLNFLASIATGFVGGRESSSTLQPPARASLRGGERPDSAPAATILCKRCLKRAATTRAGYCEPCLDLLLDIGAGNWETEL